MGGWRLNLGQLDTLHNVDYDNLDKMDEMDHYNKLVMDPGTRCTANIASGETFKTQQNFYNFSYDIQLHRTFIHPYQA